MKQAWIGILLLLAAGLTQAAPPEPERPLQVTKPHILEAAPPRQARPLNKAEVTRRIYWLVMYLR